MKCLIDSLNKRHFLRFSGLIVARFFLAFPRTGTTFMSALIASSKLNGWSETGLAFGMVPPMVNAVEHSWADTASKHTSAVAYSASCYNRVEQVRFFAVVMPERELGQVQRQVFFAHLVKGADHAPLEQAPERFQVVRMHVPAHILFLGVIDRLMEERPAQAVIAGMFIGRHQRDFIADGLTHKVAHRDPVRRLNHLTDHVPFAGDRADHRGLAAVVLPLAFFLVPMLVRVFAANIGFIYFHFAQQLRKASVFHGRPNAMAHIPGRPVVAGPDLTMDLQGADALLALGHQVNDLEPGPKRIVGVLENGLADHGEAVAVPSAALFAFADPVKRLALEGVDLLILATRALYAVRPAHIGQELLAGLFHREAGHQSAERHGLVVHRPLRGWRDYSPTWQVVLSAT